MTCRLPTLVAVLAILATTAAGRAEEGAQVEDIVGAVVKPLMARDAIPGMAVGVAAGNQTYVLTYGVASTETGKPVARDTLFEIGSISKTFTATLAADAAASGKLSLSDPTSRALPILKGTPFGEVQLLDLGTHTPGGLPLQVPDDIRTEDQLLHYFRAWKPAYPPGTRRTYTNPGIGTLGLITAKSAGTDFAALMQRRVLGPLGLAHTYIEVPAAKMADYAQGYTKADAPIRMAPGVLSAEAYGIKTDAPDLLRFVQANIDPSSVADPTLRRAIAATHTGYFKAGPMVQDLMWEQYPYPVALKALLEGNSRAMLMTATPVTRIEPPKPPSADSWINKTGSTNGFGAYAAFVPAKRLGIVILANKSYPVDDRVAAAHAILTALAASSR